MLTGVEWRLRNTRVDEAGYRWIKSHEGNWRLDDTAARDYLRSGTKPENTL